MLKDRAYVNIPLIILVGVLVFVFLLIGTYLNSSINQSHIDSQTITESFDVDDSDVNKICTLDHTPIEFFSIRYHNGTGWKTLTSSDYSVNGNVVTVLASAMD